MVDCINGESEAVRAIIGDDKKTECPLWIKSWNGYNHLPEPTEEMDLYEAIDHLIHWNVRNVFFKQVHYDNDNFMKGMYSCKIFLFSNMGIILCDDWKNKKIIALRLGCKHKNINSKNLGRCYNEYTCKDCGYAWRVDSSD